jgi:hypothetical protein
MRCCCRAVAEHGKAGDVRGGAGTRERVPGGRGRHVVADQLHADAPFADRRTAEIGHRIRASRHKHIGRAVIRPGRGDALEIGRHADQQVAHAGADRAPHETAALRPPVVFQRGVQVLRDQFGDLVFEAGAFLVRVRQVVGIGADPQLARLRRPAPPH